MVGFEQSGVDGESGTLTSNNLLGKDGVRHRGTASTPAVEGLGPNAIGQGIMQNGLLGQQVKHDGLVETDEKVRETEGLVVQELQKACAFQDHRYKPVDDGHRYKKRLNPSRHGGLAEKVFLPRNSLLTDLYEDKHIQTIYNICLVILLVLFIHTVVYDLVVKGRWNFGIELVQWNFQGFRACSVIWLTMVATTVLLFCCFKLWAVQRNRWTQNSLGRRCWDNGWLILLVVYQVAFLCVLPVKIMETFVPPALSVALLLEQIRLMMKTYAFVRTNAPRALAHKFRQTGDSQEMPACPAFSKFLYFLFAPTLIYKDEYPRTKEIRWNFVIRYFMEVIGCIFYKAFILEHFLMPVYREFGLPNRHDKPLYKMVVVGVFGSVIPGTFYLLVGFYLSLHAWMNACAELMHFADRMFYKDWWTASSQAAYFRSWNIIVHDWLYTYIYRDFSEILVPGKRFFQAEIVFIISAIFHEYILTFTFRFFYPILFVAFGGFAAVMFAWKKDLVLGGNILVWLLLSLGSGVLACLYGFEWYARINCPRVLDPVSDFFVPRSWTCSNLVM